VAIVVCKQCGQGVDNEDSGPLTSRITAAGIHGSYFDCLRYLKGRVAELERALRIEEGRR
jgi:hypothetical protein